MTLTTFNAFCMPTLHMANTKRDVCSHTILILGLSKLTREGTAQTQETACIVIWGGLR